SAADVQSAAAWRHRVAEARSITEAEAAEAAREQERLLAASSRRYQFTLKAKARPPPPPRPPGGPPPPHWRSPDPYVVLDVRRDASRAAARKAWLRLALKYHPDKSKSHGTRDAFIATRVPLRRLRGFGPAPAAPRRAPPPPAAPRAAAPPPDVAAAVDRATAARPDRGVVPWRRPAAAKPPADGEAGDDGLERHSKVLAGERAVAARRSRGAAAWGQSARFPEAPAPAPRDAGAAETPLSLKRATRPDVPG
ncbi:expressed protein, partial [Aureococcus anophagefferens]